MWLFGKKQKKTQEDDTAQKLTNQSNQSKEQEVKVAGTVVIAEDETDLREVLTDKLEEEGFKVFPTINGEECIEVAFREHPDLILLDLYMPKVSGFEVLDRMLGDEWGKDANIIVLTNRGDFTSKRNVYNLKHVSYLIKAETSLETVVKEIREKITLSKDD